MRGLLGGLLALALWASNAPAQVMEAMEIGPLSIELNAPWGLTTNKGYHPLQIKVVNREGQKQTLGLVLRSKGNVGLQLLRDVVVAPHGTYRFELLVPGFLISSQACVVTASLPGEDPVDEYLKSGGDELDCHKVGLFSIGARKAGRAERWSEVLSPEPPSKSHWGGPWRREYRGEGLHSKSEWEDGATVSIADVSFDEMSADWRAYTSLDFAVLDLDSGVPNPRELGALLAWVRTGGELLLAGADVDAKLARLDALQPWLEDRFQLEPWIGHKAIRRYQCGLGRVLVAPLEGLFDQADISAVVLKEMRARTRTEWTPSFRGSRGMAAGIDPAVLGIGDLPYRMFIVFMILFGIVIWPVNFYWVKRLGKPAWLLVTIPGIALASALVVLGYGFLEQGIAIKTDSTSLALLDQRSGRLSHVEARALYAGLAPSGGQVPAAGTALFAWDSPRAEGSGLRYRIEHHQGELRFRSAFLPSRRQVRHALVSERMSQLRLDFDADGSVSNGLGTEVLGLVLRDHAGEWWSLAGALEAGGEAQLVPSAGRPSFEVKALKLPRFNASSSWDLPPGTYAASLAGGVFNDDVGLDLVELSGSHSLLGVLANTEAGK